MPFILQALLVSEAKLWHKYMTTFMILDIHLLCQNVAKTTDTVVSQFLEPKDISVRYSSLRFNSSYLELPIA